MNEILNPSEIGNPETPEKKGDNPREFFAGFFNSPDVQNMINERLNMAQQKDPSVTKQEAWKAIASNPDVKNAFWDFQNRNPYELDED